MCDCVCTCASEPGVFHSCGGVHGPHAGLDGVCLSDRQGFCQPLSASPVAPGTSATGPCSAHPSHYLLSPAPSLPFAPPPQTKVTEEGRTERWIVASCGHYSVVWNFRR